MNRETIYDPIRKKRVALTPEETVRQFIINELTEKYGYPLSLMNCEYTIDSKLINYRGDIVVFDKNGNPLMIIECKAPYIRITRDVFEQIFNYNKHLKVSYLLISNGKDTYVIYIDYHNNKIDYLTNIPPYNELFKKEDI
jgi:hypothetical protein